MFRIADHNHLAWHIRARRIAGQRVEDLCLDAIGILELIDEDEVELLADPVNDRRIPNQCQRSDEEGKALVISLYLHDFLKKANLELKSIPRSWSERIHDVPAGALTPKEDSIAFHREGQNPLALYKE